MRFRQQHADKVHSVKITLSDSLHDSVTLRCGKIHAIQLLSTGGCIERSVS